MYLVKSNDPRAHTVIAMRDAYVDFNATSGHAVQDTLLFTLNNPELTIESFRLQQEQLLAEITADRLSKEYVEQLIFTPMQATIDFAAEDLKFAQEQTQMVKALIHRGDLYEGGAAQQETVALVEGRRIILERAQADFIQRTIEIEGQRRRLNAEQADLVQRIQLDANIKKLHQYILPASGNVEFFTYSGAFVKENDSICSVLFDSPVRL